MDMKFDYTSDNSTEEFAVAEKNKKRIVQKRRIKLNWSNNQIFLLISEVKIRNALWNCFNPQYHFPCARDDLWNEIAQKMNIDKREIRNKWSSIRNSYRLRYMKLKNSCDERNASMKESYSGYYQRLLFLEPTLQLNAKNTSMRVNKTSQSISSTSMDTEDDGSAIVEENVLSPSPFTSSPSFSKSEVKMSSVKVVEENGEGGKEYDGGPLHRTKTPDSWNEIGNFIAMNGRRWAIMNKRLEAKFRSALYKLVSDVELEVAMTL